MEFDVLSSSRNLLYKFDLVPFPMIWKNNVCRRKVEDENQSSYLCDHKHPGMIRPHLAERTNNQLEESIAIGSNYRSIKSCDFLQDEIINEHFTRWFSYFIVVVQNFKIAGWYLKSGFFLMFILLKKSQKSHFIIQTILWYEWLFQQTDRIICYATTFALSSCSLKTEQVIK